jgi:RNA-splicing ligase RtcB
MINGKTLIDWGFQPGPQFKAMIAEGNELRKRGVADDEIKEQLKDYVPAPVEEISMRTNRLHFGDFLKDGINRANDDEVINYYGVVGHMDVLMRVPTIVRGAIMPDACPSGSAPGTIPVGGVVATENAIHPGFHSADICCSMAISVFKRREDVGRVLDAAMKASHFGVGKRTASEVRQHKELVNLVNTFENNPFLKGLEDYGIHHFMTQGDGNHFFYVGEIESTGQLAIVTHHGSRGLGGGLYKRGKAVAQKHTAIVAPRVPLHNAWIDADTQNGQDYWSALQTVRLWTKMNHFAIHDAVAKRIGNAVVDRWWNEHNFVFQKSDGLFYHAKGATPSYSGFAADDSGATLIPLNMAQPILITRHRNNDDALGFAPHGAGRNLSRTAHMKRLAAEFGDHRGLSPRAVETIIERETKGLDVRFYTGVADVSELPSAYKNADQVHKQIAGQGLAHVADRIMPLGSIMAGEMNWNRKR